MTQGHEFSTVASIPLKPCRTEVWTFGLIKQVNLPAGNITISHNSSEVVVDITMIRSTDYRIGEQVTCLAYLNMDYTLLAKIVRVCPELDFELFLKHVK